MCPSFLSRFESFRVLQSFLLCFIYLTLFGCMYQNSFDPLSWQLFQLVAILLSNILDLCFVYDFSRHVYPFQDPGHLSPIWLLLGWDSRRRPRLLYPILCIGLTDPDSGCRGGGALYPWLFCIDFVLIRHVVKCLIFGLPFGEGGQWPPVFHCFGMQPVALRGFLKSF